MDSLRFLQVLFRSPADQRRQILLQQADLNNQAAMSFLRADKEIGLVRYYGISRYLREKQVIPTFPALLSQNTSAATTETAETRPSLGEPGQQVAKVPFMITKLMREELEELQYSPESVRQMTPVKANIVLKHKLSPERYEAEIGALLEQQEEAMRYALTQEETDTSPEVVSNDEAKDDTLVDTQPINGGRVWFEVIEHNQGKDPTVVGLFAQESEALSCLKVYEKLATKKNSKSTYITKEARRP